MRLYSDLARWWPLLSPPSHYGEEAAFLVPLLEPDPARRLSLLELGSGGGSFAWHLAAWFTLSLTDRSEAMLALSRGINPGAEHAVGDMRTLALGQRFDRVLVHDAIMYAATDADLLATMRTARQHVTDEGLVMLIPDCVTETFEAESTVGGEDGDDGRALRYLEWTWDADPTDGVITTLFVLAMREADGRVSVEQDLHRFGLFPRDTWFRLLAEAGFTATSVRDPWNRDVFLCRPVAP